MNADARFICVKNEKLCKIKKRYYSKKRKENSNYGFLSVFCVIGNFLFPITQKTLREYAHFAEKKQMLRIPLKRERVASDSLFCVNCEKYTKNMFINCGICKNVKKHIDKICL